jgi:hypothetical protein
MHYLHESQAAMAAARARTCPGRCLLSSRWTARRPCWRPSCAEVAFLLLTTDRRSSRSGSSIKRRRRRRAAAVASKVGALTRGTYDVHWAPGRARRASPPRVQPRASWWRRRRRRRPRRRPLWRRPAMMRSRLAPRRGPWTPGHRAPPLHLLAASLHLQKTRLGCMRIVWLSVVL